MLAPLIAAALAVLWAVGVRPSSTGTRYFKGRTIQTSATGSRPGEVDGMGIPNPITANGNSGWLNSEDIADLNLSLTVAGPVTGTAPTLDVLVETAADAAGTIGVRTLVSFTQKTGVTALERKNASGLDAYYRVRWTVGGTAPSFGGVTLTGEGK
jgi:hypothetical protein